jgi:nicotinate dehydrogenase subunit B
VSSVYELAAALAPVLGRPAKAIRVQFWEGSSAYGSGAPFTDAAQAAGLMSKLIGKPVRVQFMRWDEHGWDNYTPPEVMDIRGGVDAEGNIVAYDHTSFAIPFITPGQGDTTRQLLGAAFPPPGPGDPDGESDTAAHYKVANRRITVKTLPLKDNYLKSQYVRTVAATPNFFGSEQMIDELAHAAKMDPLQFRVKNFGATNGSTFGAGGTPNTHRWLELANALQEISNWQPKVAASNLSGKTVVSGRGVAIAPYEGSYVGTVADVLVNKKTGKISVKHLYVVFDAGLIINPGLVDNQTIGGNVQATSRALLEEVTFTRSRVTSLDWVTYPVLRFVDSPNVTTKMIQRTDQPSTGAGEPQMVATAPAIANAFFDATGIRIRQMPMTAPRVRAVLKAGGGGTPGVP